LCTANATAPPTPAATAAVSSVPLLHALLGRRKEELEAENRNEKEEKGKKKLRQRDGKLIEKEKRRKEKKGQKGEETGSSYFMFPKKEKR